MYRGVDDVPCMKFVALFMTWFDHWDYGALAMIPSHRESATNFRLMPGFRHSVAVIPLPFRRCKIPLFCKNYVRKFRSVTAVNGKNLP